MPQFTLRKAQPGDAGLVLYFIKKLAEYDDRSLSSYINQVLKAHLEHKSKE